MKDNSWLSDRTKTIMVTVTMLLLVGGMGWGYYAMNEYSKERTIQKQELVVEEKE